MNLNENIPVVDLEVIAAKNSKYQILYMNSIEWIDFIKYKREKGFKYQSYQKGFSQFKLEINIK